LEQSGVEYAICGDNAVAAWVATIDESAVRFAKDVVICIRRADLESAARSLEQVGFQRKTTPVKPVVFDGPDARPWDVVNLLIADDLLVPDILPFVKLGDNGVRYMPLGPLVRMNLVGFRVHNRLHVRDLIDVGLVDQSWTARFDSVLAARLQQLLDTPDGQPVARGNTYLTTPIVNNRFA
jgi:hypothetical protein